MLNTNFSQGADDIVAVLDWLQTNPTVQASSDHPADVLVLGARGPDRPARRGPAAPGRLLDRLHGDAGVPGPHGPGQLRPRLPRSTTSWGSSSASCRSWATWSTWTRTSPTASSTPWPRWNRPGRTCATSTCRSPGSTGKFDNWVKSEFIRDVMSVQVDAPREVISVPIGHNARTSKEGLRLFGTITVPDPPLPPQAAHPAGHARPQGHGGHAAGREGPPAAPQAQEPGQVLAALPHRRRQAHRLRRHGPFGRLPAAHGGPAQGPGPAARGPPPRPRRRDRATSSNTSSLAGGGLPSQITIADLIPEAMQKASRKLCSRFPALREPGRLDLLALDLEMSRYLAIRRFLDGEVGDFEEMAERVENLTLESAIKIQEDYSPRLHRILRGERDHSGPRRLAEDPVRRPGVPHHHGLQPGRPVRPGPRPRPAGAAAAAHARRRSRAPSTCRSRRAGITRS
ncbi:MAG: hypothetical protein MZV64_63015 [Ignavibacteriales bacterium]|nr:hypothetical protein [Ignavibacteriales bacterium]